VNIRPIRNDADHERALERLTALLERTPALDSEESSEIEVLGTLIEKYEAEHYPVAWPSPVEAIRFRMDQEGLRNKDLVPYIGSPSKVSEVLNGKRPLSLTMIRKLHRHLGIPAEVLLDAPGEAGESAGDDPDPSSFPAREMHRRGYFAHAPDRWSDAKREIGRHLKGFMQSAGIKEASAAYCRSTAHYRQGKTMQETALLAWQARVLIRARERAVPSYAHGTVTKAFLDRVAALSVLDDGPRCAREFLEKHGIALVVEPHLQRTYLDGAAFLSEDGQPVIGLTLRHDKLDNFWFTLLHELVHVGWHLSGERRAIFDDLSEAAQDALEQEADKKAAEVLIPTPLWKNAAVRSTQRARDARQFAISIQRHHAIVVGRLQRDTDDFSLLARTIGIGRRQVRCQFPEFDNQRAPA